jgi:hypothetical protein
VNNKLCFILCQDKAFEDQMGSVEYESSQTSESSEEKFEDAKGAIRNRISKKNRQYNGQKKVQTTIYISSIDCALHKNVK